MNQTQTTSQPALSRRLLLFTDLDGCLLNKSDYDHSPAIPALQRLTAADIPVILCSSKTRSEMAEIAKELELRPAPMTCENGGVIFLENTAEGDAMILGRQRSEILSVLTGLKNEFHFRSFADLGLEGIMETTDLPRTKAIAANDRQCTEPLLWDDELTKIEQFRASLADNGLTLTQGGRFWHVAASVTKGTAMQTVLERFQSRMDSSDTWTTIAIGDSPIDQSMLELADIPIGIPQPSGEVKVTIDNEQGMIAENPGPEGWAQSVGIVLDRLGIPA